MKLKNLIVGSIVLGSSILLGGCADKYYETIVEEHNTIVEGSLIFSDEFKISKDSWEWNSVYNRYEFVLDYEWLTQDVYDRGLPMAYMFLIEKDANDNEYEVQKPLPFTRNFYEKIEEGKDIVYSEQFGFDMVIGKISFYIENSDKAPRSDYLEDGFFKVAVVWDGLEGKSK